jgi:hypothetical protein
VSRPVRPYRLPFCPSWCVVEHRNPQGVAWHQPPEIRVELRPVPGMVEHNSRNEPAVYPDLATVNVSVVDRVDGTRLPGVVDVVVHAAMLPGDARFLAASLLYAAELAEHAAPERVR